MTSKRSPVKRKSNVRKSKSSTSVANTVKSINSPNTDDPLNLSLVDGPLDTSLVTAIINTTSDDDKNLQPTLSDSDTVRPRATSNSVTVSDSEVLSLASLKSLIDEKDLAIKNLEKHVNKLEGKVNHLEGKVLMLEGHLSLAKTVSSRLECMVDSQEQYSRRPCVVVDGIVNGSFDHVVKILAETGIHEQEVRDNIDKMHPIGRPDALNSQSLIVKFKTHNFKEQVYLKRKFITRQNIRVKPSLTKRRIGLLKGAKHFCLNHEDFNYCFADMFGNLKVVLKRGLRGRKVHDFNSYQDLHDLSHKIGNDVFFDFLPDAEGGDFIP